MRDALSKTSSNIFQPIDFGVHLRGRHPVFVRQQVDLEPRQGRHDRRYLVHDHRLEVVADGVEGFHVDKYKFAEEFCDVVRVNSRGPTYMMVAYVRISFDVDPSAGFDRVWARRDDSWPCLFFVGCLPRKF